MKTRTDGAILVTPAAPTEALADSVGFSGT